MMIPISLVLALFIMLLEVLVAFIQAYIFTLLTVHLHRDVRASRALDRRNNPF